jgi:hypothetical protein
VPSAAADLAKQNLIARVARAGYRLTNTMVVRAGKIVRRPTPFLTELREAPLQHLSTPAPRDSVFLAWQAQFIPASGDLRPVTGDELHPDEVPSFVGVLEYSSPDARQVSVLIANAFDPGFQGSTVDVVQAFQGKHKPGDLQHILMRLQDVWVFRKGLQAERTKGYRLTRRHTASQILGEGGNWEEVTLRITEGAPSSFIPHPLRERRGRRGSIPAWRRRDHVTPPHFGGRPRPRHGPRATPCPVKARNGLVTTNTSESRTPLKFTLAGNSGPPARGHVRRLNWWPDWSRSQPRLAPGGSYFKPAAINRKQKPCWPEIHAGYSPCDTAIPSTVWFEKEPEA